MLKNKCACYICKKEVPGEIEKHFTAKDGRILCTKCSLGVVPVDARMKEILIKNENS